MSEAETPAPDRSAAPEPDPRGRAVAFAVTWVSYASYYLGRKGLSVSKATIERMLGKSALYGVETAYLAAYALGQYGSGYLGDRVGARRLIGFGMLASAAACFAFGASAAGAVFLVAMFVNGLAQSTGWPGNIKAMSEWTPPERRGVTMGFWSTCYQVGGIVATSVAARFLRAYGWQGAYLGPAVVIAIVGVGVLLLLRPGPLGAKTSEGGSGMSAEEKAALSAARRDLLKSPVIWSYGVSYFFIKLIRYSLLFWLPYYLEKVLHYETQRAADLSNAFEIGGVIGSVGLGLLSDRLKNLPRGVVPAASLVALAGALYLYQLVGGSSQLANFFSMALVGMLLFGPDALLSGAAAQDAGGPRAAALAAGMINGIGSIGAILQELVTRGVSGRWGWNALFHCFVGFALVGAVCLIPTFRRRTAPAAVPA